MKILLRSFVLLGLLGTMLRGAEPPTVAQVLALAMKEPKQAALVIEYAVEDHPPLLLPLVEAAVKALPDQAVEIVAGLMKAVNKGSTEGLSESEQQRRRERRREILRLAIVSQPKLAVRFAEMALTQFSVQYSELLQTALAAAPADARSGIETVAAKLSEAEAARAAANQGKKGKSSPGHPGGFPRQPVRPELISPSS